MHSHFGRDVAKSPDTRGLAKIGAIAQLVEQRTENPCVPGSIPGGTTSRKADFRVKLIACGDRLLIQG